jgi:hypothetical protein
MNNKPIVDAYPTIDEFERQLTLAWELSQKPGVPLATKQFLSRIQADYDEFGWTLKLTDAERLQLRRHSEGLS